MATVQFCCSVHNASKEMNNSARFLDMDTLCHCAFTQKQSYYPMLIHFPALQFFFLYSVGQLKQQITQIQPFNSQNTLLFPCCRFCSFNFSFEWAEQLSTSPLIAEQAKFSTTCLILILFTMLQDTYIDSIRFYYFSYSKWYNFILAT